MSSDLEKLEERLRNLEESSFTKSEREVLRFLIRVVKAIEGTLWLVGGISKLNKLFFFLAPFVAMWYFWDHATQGVLNWLNTR